MSDVNTGTLVLVSNERGDVIGTCVDFGSAVAGGFTTEESQTRRARDQAWTEAIKSQCTEALADAILIGYTRYDLSQRLKQVCKWKEQVINVTRD